MKCNTIEIKSQASIYKLGYRLFDIVFSLLVIIGLLPLFLLIALSLRLSSRGNVLFTQERLGKDGVVFKCLKFRTMHVDAEKKLETILKKDDSLANEWKIHQKLKMDPRVFPLGKFLRKTSLDEFPQFWNVLKGELSVVGPRPYAVSQKNELGPHGQIILSVRPGVTGLWQVMGRGKTTFLERIEMDIAYVKMKRFSTDLRLIIKTIPLLFFPNDAS